MPVATNYFTKWAEVEAYAQIKATQLILFVQRSIVCKFGVPHSLVLDNGMQFISKAFQQFCIEYVISNVYSSPRYPQSNGQAEVKNETLLRYLKNLFTTTKGKWVDKFSVALWAYRTTPRQPTGGTPYSLAFGAEAWIPIEFGLEPLRTFNLVELA